MATTCNLNLIKDKADNKLLPFQYYNNLGFITLPINGKIPFLKGWNLLTKTVHPVTTLQNIAVLCGKISGVSVLDFDSQEAIDIFNDLCKKFNYTINTPVVLTKKGMHIYYKYDKDLKSSLKLIKGNKKIDIDYRSNGSLNLLPPSVIDSFKYKCKRGLSFNDTTIKKMPVWLKKFIKEHQSN
jgi:hypothetical protein